MADQIRVLIVDDIPETRDHLSKLLGFEGDIDVVGAAASGTEALKVATSLTPGRRPDGHQHAGYGRHRDDRRDGASGAHGLRDHDVRPGRGRLPPPLDACGAREFLVKPFSSDELTASIRQVYAREKEKMSRMAIVAAETSHGAGGTSLTPTR